MKVKILSIANDVFNDTLIKHPNQHIDFIGTTINIATT